MWHTWKFLGQLLFFKNILILYSRWTCIIAKYSRWMCSIAKKWQNKASHSLSNWTLLMIIKIHSCTSSILFLLFSRGQNIKFCLNINLLLYVALSDIYILFSFAYFNVYVNEIIMCIFLCITLFSITLRIQMYWHVKTCEGSEIFTLLPNCWASLLQFWQNT